MNVSLTPELEGFARRLVDTGRYNSASEVVRESLRLLQERESKTAELRRLIQEGLEGGGARSFDREELRTLITDRMTELRAEVERGARTPPTGDERIDV